jgi:hypothetical protein
MYKQFPKITILSDKKPLKIELVTFRDKLQPNSKEKWTVKVSGDEKEKVTAEVLANMYDKSLDQFASILILGRRFTTDLFMFLNIL